LIFNIFLVILICFKRISRRTVKILGSLSELIGLCESRLVLAHLEYGFWIF